MGAKNFNASKIAREIYRGEGDRISKLEEVRKHQVLLPHSNCVHFYQSWEEKGRLYQQFELCEGNLMELSETQHDIPESTIWAYLVDLLLVSKTKMKISGDKYRYSRCFCSY